MTAYFRERFSDGRELAIKGVLIRITTGINGHFSTNDFNFSAFICNRVSCARCAIDALRYFSTVVYASDNIGFDG